MFSIENVFNALIFLEAAGVVFYFGMNQPKRRLFWVRFLLSCVAFTTVAFFSYNINLGNVFLSQVLNYSLLFFMIWLSVLICFDIPVSSVTLLSTLSYTNRHSVYLIWQLLNYLYEDISKKSSSNYTWVWLILSLFSFALSLPFLIYTKKKLVEKPNLSLAPFKITLISILTLFFVIIFNLISIYALPLDGPRFILYILNLSSILSCILIIQLMFSYLSENALEEEISAINQLRHEEEKQYQMSKENIDLINIKCHDLRHQIRNLTNSGKVISKEELDKIQNAISIYDTKVKTGNPSLDVILQEKSLICKKNRIVFSPIIDGESLSFMKDGDIYALFGNIVDNAIQSTMKLENPEERVITLKVKRVAGGTFAYEENAYPGSLRFKDGLPVSESEPSGYHGFGMKSIKLIVSDYHGTMTIKAENQLFSISLFFPDQENR